MATIRKRVTSGAVSSDGTYLPDEQALNEIQTATLPGGADADILSYTVPPGKTLYLAYGQASGQNLGRFDLTVDGILKDRRRTFWGGDFSVEFNFVHPGRFGFPVAPGSIVKIRARHDNPVSGIFEAKLSGVLKG